MQVRGIVEVRTAIQGHSQPTRDRVFQEVETTKVWRVLDLSSQSRDLQCRSICKSEIHKATAGQLTSPVE